MISDDSSEAAKVPESETPNAMAAPSRGFSLATMLIVVTLFSLICGISVLLPGLGLAAAILTAPAVARTAIIARHTSRGANGSRVMDIIELFVASASFTLVFGLAAGICCFGSCFPAFFAGSFVGQLWEHGDYGAMTTGLITGFGTGGLVALSMGYIAITKLGLPVAGWKISRGEKALVMVCVLVAVVCGFILFFRVVNSW